MRRIVIGIALVAVTSAQAADVEAPALRQRLAEFSSADQARQREMEKEIEKDPATALPKLALWKSGRPDPDHRGGDAIPESLARGRSEAVPGLLALLDRDDWKLREAAIQIIGWIGPAAEPAVPSLVRALRDPAWGIRMQACFALRSVGVFTPEATDALRGRLGDEAWIVANAASLALASDPAKTTSALAGALGDANPRIRRFAAHALSVMRRPPEVLLPRLLDLLQNDAPEVRLEVITALRNLTSSELRGAIPTLIELLESPALRCAAGRLLAVKGERHAVAALPVLIALMRTPAQSDECADRVFQDVAAIGPAAVPALVGLLDHPVTWIRRNAVLALSAIEPRTADSLKAIAGVMADESLGDVAQQSLAELGAEAEGVLIEALLSDSSASRRRAAYALGRSGPAAAAAVPTLVARLPLESGETKRAMMIALGWVGGERSHEAILELRRALADPTLRRDAAGALARIAGAEAADVAPILIDALRIEVTAACRHGTAHLELASIGGAALPYVLGLLTDESFPSKMDVLGLLDAIGQEGLAAARSVFTGWIHDDRSPWALHAAERLQKLDDPPTDRLAAIFARALEDQNPWNRLRGAEGLVRCKVDGALASPVLLELRTHEFEVIRSRAEDALQQLLGS